MAGLNDYIEQRVQPRIGWYDKRAVACKWVYLSTQYFTVVASASVVLFIHLESIPRFVPTALAAAVALIVALERIGQFGNRWHLYRLCAETLETEKQFYLHRAGPYEDNFVDADRLFVERTEQLLMIEAANWNSLLRFGRLETEAKRLPRA